MIIPESMIAFIEFSPTKDRHFLKYIVQPEN